MKKTLIFFEVILVFCVLINAHAGETSVPPLINYQGMLTDAEGKPMTGTKTLEFNIYDAAGSGTKIWGPQIFNAVPLISGKFNVILGTTDTAGRSVAEAFGAKERYLGIKVDSGAELVPRQQILSAPFAIQSVYADVAKTVRGTDLYVDPQTGNVGIGTAAPDEKLVIASGGIKFFDGGIKFSDGTNQTSFVLPPPDFDSGWFEMHSQAGVASYKEIEHGLGVYPSRVKVLVKAIDGANAGFIFEGSGTAQGDDDDSHQYGGVIFAYNQTEVRMWAPDKSNSNNIGSIINIADGWGGEVNAQQSHTAEVKVLVWK